MTFTVVLLQGLCIIPGQDKCHKYNLYFIFIKVYFDYDLKCFFLVNLCEVSIFHFIYFVEKFLVDGEE